VASRQRYCKFALAKDSKEFCPMHKCGSGDNERVPCPLDPNHTVLKRDLEKHIPKCNKALEDQFSSRQPFTLNGCNCAQGDESAAHLTDLAPITAEEMSLWREKLVRAREVLITRINSTGKGSIDTEESTMVSSRWSESVNDCARHLTDKEWESRNEIDKHNLQNACILQVLERNGLLPGRSQQAVFVELGCGKAGLTRWLIHALPDNASDSSAATQPVFMLLEYEARRNKNENKKEIKSKIPHENILRLRSNIKDVDLSQFLCKAINPAPEPRGKPGSAEERLFELEAKVHNIQSRDSWPYTRVIGTAKHLCGAATDFGLRCLSRISDRNISLVFATCCHHRCDWNQLVNKQVLEELGVCSTPTEFKRLISMAGWATTAGVGEEKRFIGRLVKSVIDLSRILWIIHTFPRVEVVEYHKYIEDGITPENFCIVMRSNS
jgi:tRNA:m4X modification enzyme